MRFHPPSRLPLALVFTLFACGCGRLSGDQTELGNQDLSASEVRQARELAEKSLNIPTTLRSPLDRVYFIKVDLLPDSQAETSNRLVVVTHYRYQGDEAVLTTVDLNKLEIVRVEPVPHMATGLAPEEVTRAENLARTHPQLAELFRTDVQSLARPVTLGYSDPLYGRRVVHLALVKNGQQLASPRVLVDLTSETVYVEQGEVNVQNLAP